MNIEFFLGLVNGGKWILRGDDGEEEEEKERRMGKMRREEGEDEEDEEEEEEKRRRGRQGGPEDPQLTQHFRPSISKSCWFSWSWRRVDGMFC